MNGIRGPLRVPENFYSLEVCPGYCISHWMNDADVNKDERLFLKRLATQSPYLIDLPESQSEVQGYDFKIDGKTALGCGIAYLLGGMSISLRSDPKWDTPSLEVVVEQLGEEGIVHKTVEIVHASCVDHIRHHVNWIKGQIVYRIHTGGELWDRRGELFPSLIFCSSVEKQVRRLEYGTSMLDPVVRHLFELQRFCQSWTNGTFDKDKIPLRVSPESEPTLLQFAKERTFVSPDGVERVFSWHTKINYNAWRIHFDFDNDNPSTLIVGYIGQHLPTATDRT